MTHSCRTCGDHDCPKWGTDNAECEDYTSIEEAETSSAFYVYVANRLSGHPGEYLANLHEMCKVSRLLMDSGYVPLNPGGDMLDGLMSGDVLPVEHYQRRSLDLLRLLGTVVSCGGRAAMYVHRAHHRDGTPSGGVHDEIRECERMGVPVVWSVEELAGLRREWAEKVGGRA